MSLLAQLNRRGLDMRATAGRIFTHRSGVTGSIDHPRNLCRTRDPVGFVGLGNMGSCMANNLLRVGHNVVLFDVDRSKTSRLVEAGATLASSLEDLARTCSSIVTMLPNTPHVESVYLGKPLQSWAGNDDFEDADTDDFREGILENASRGTLLIDCSTIDPMASRKVNKMASAKGMTMLDAPVSGGVRAATDGTLTFIVGGSRDGLTRAENLLNAMGTRVFHVGGAGDGCVAKLCNNLCLAISMIGVSEAMSLGSSMGLDPKTLANVLNSSTAKCWSSDSNNPCPGVMENAPAARGFDGGFASSLMQKDLHLALQAAQKCSQSLPLGYHTYALYSKLSDLGYGSKDFSSVYELIAARRGTRGA